MKTVYTKFPKLLLLLPALLLFLSCSNDEEAYARVTVNGTLLMEDVSDFNGDINASFTGNGGTATRSFVWNNNLSTADFNADITSTASGSFQMIVEDSQGMVVLDRTILGSNQEDTIGGVTAAGSAGLWTVTIIVTNFNGDGSFSLSEGN
ncbi:hypothetical protein OZ410_13835 [Robiginitalea sp. M366]|uniref:hypothetical protein n=1 Tax=Robiginitalea aestuariiviva TaxID=3036903 RepID=UPI00240DFE67|nr:hypothetical protein [Robiginitalea aestuariiviva]MDG1573405.1 hypothetical protein [Robiginitalea aestuariiviva]